MVNQCSNCGAGLRFDIATQRLKCDSCDSDFDPDEYSRSTDAEEDNDPSEIEVTLFSCPNCGGEITSTEEEAAQYCLYCGSFVTLSSRLTKMKVPGNILPFSRTQEQCCESYSKMIKRKLYAPKEFRNQSFIKGFKGIYIPYWVYDYTYGPDVTMNGSTSTRSGDYIEKQLYKIKCQIDGRIEGISYDASSSFDDNISHQLSPFASSKMKPFNPSYMFGFYADTADVSEDLYTAEADETAQDDIWDRIESNPEIAKGHPDRPEYSRFKSDFHLKRSCRLALLPVWFLTWRRGERVAYSAVNGDSGEIYSEIPVDIFRYLVISLITALPIFFLLNAFCTFNGSKLLLISIILSLSTLLIYEVQLEKILRRLKHADDAGYLSVNTEAQKDVERNVTDNIIGIVLDSVKELLSFNGISGFIGTIVLVGGAVIFMSEYVIFGLLIFALFLPIYTIYRIVKCSKILNDKLIGLDIAGAVAALVASIIVYTLSPANDMFYYVTAIVCMIGIAFTAVSTIERYNDLITRPVPHWEARNR